MRIAGGQLARPAATSVSRLHYEIDMRRRDLLKGAGALAAASPVAASSAPLWSEPLPPPPPARYPLPDLKPARWIWYPSERTLPNTFVLFRRPLNLPARPRRATGWIHAESRYLLEVNGKRVQWGPPPSDPRWPTTRST